MGERIRELRKALGFTQQEFSERIGVRRNTVAQYEMGRNPPNDTVITLICREFGVNEDWLRAGIGEMFRPRSRNEELFDFLNTALEEDPNGMKVRLLTVMSRLSEEQWELLADMARKLADETKKADPE